MRGPLLAMAFAGVMAPAQLPSQTSSAPLPGVPAGACRMVTDWARSRLVAISFPNALAPNPTHHEWDGSRWIDRRGLIPPTMSSRMVLPSIVYDEVRRRVVLFGGQASLWLDEHWEFDGETWRMASPSLRPSPRCGAAMAYDQARSRIVLHGGYGNYTRLGDLWEYDGQTWIQRLIPAPPAQADHVMAYDATRRECVMFGEDGTTRTYDGATWRSRYSPQVPAPRTRAAMAYDPVRQRILMHGGAGVSGADDDWEWDGIRWWRVYSWGSSDHGMAYDPVSRCTLVAGGIEASGQHVTWLTSTSRFNGSSWTQAQSYVTTNASLTTAFDSARRKLVTVHGYYTYESNGPHLELRNFDYQLPDYGGDMVYDPTRNWMMVFGGQSWGQQGYVDWTRRWDGQRWSSSPTGPAARAWHRMAFDPVRNGIILFGGIGGSGGNHIYFDDTWLFTGSWTRLQPASRPSPRYGHAMAGDPVRGRVLLFGGVDPLSVLDDTWEWDGATWTNPLPATIPGARAHAGMVFEPAQGRILMQGGYDLRKSSQIPGTTWTWNGQDWQRGETWRGYYETHLVYDQNRRTVIQIQPHRETVVRTASIAHVASLGTQCGNASLTSDPPYLGNLGHRLEVLHAPAGAPIGLAYAHSTLPQPLGGGCVWQLAGPSAAWFAVANSLGVANVRAPIPLDARFRGIRLYAQAAVLDPNAPWGGLAVTAARQITVGD